MSTWSYYPYITLAAQITDVEHNRGGVVSPPF